MTAQPVENGSPKRRLHVDANFRREHPAAARRSRLRHCAGAARYLPVGAVGAALPRMISRQIVEGLQTIFRAIARQLNSAWSRSWIATRSVSLRCE